MSTDVRHTIENSAIELHFTETIHATRCIQCHAMPTQAMLHLLLMPHDDWHGMAGNQTRETFPSCVVRRAAHWLARDIAHGFDDCIN